MTEPAPAYTAVLVPTAKELALLARLRELRRAGVTKYSVRDLAEYYMVAEVLPERKAEGQAEIK